LALITSVLNAIFGAFLGVSVLLIFVGAIIFFFDKPKLRIILHLCWMLFTLVSFIALLISLLLFVVNAGGFAFCDYVGYKVFRWDDPSYKPTSNPEFENLNDEIFKLDGTGYDMMVACFKSLGGDGDILEPLGVKDQLDAVSSISEKLDISSGYTTELNTVET
jgi:ABC-type cobalt transport system substrate-binding protein